MVKKYCIYKPYSITADKQFFFILFAEIWITSAGLEMKSVYHLEGVLYYLVYS